MRLRLIELNLSTVAIVRVLTWSSVLMMRMTVLLSILTVTTSRLSWRRRQEKRVDSVVVDGAAASEAEVVDSGDCESVDPVVRVDDEDHGARRL